MKNSKFFRLLCYCLLPILTAILVVSIFYILMVYEGDYVSEEDYFKSTMFLYPYLGRIEDRMNTLIYANEGWQTIKDGENTIYQYGNAYKYGLENTEYFLIIYGNKALTNVKFSEETNTLEKIKTYVQEKNSNFLNFENSKFSTNSEAFDDEILSNYFYNISFTYYNTRGEEVEFQENVILEEENIVGEVPIIQETIKPATETPVEYHTAYGGEFTFYTSYTPKLNQGVDKMIIDIMSFLTPYGDILYVVMPISALVILLIAIFLLNSIGHNKEKEGIEISDFDKVPLELILIVFAAIFVFSLVVISEYQYLAFSVQIMVTIGITIFLVNFVLLEVIFITVVTRLKAKKFLDTCLSGKIIKWCWNTGLKIIKGFVNILKKFRQQLKNVKKSLNNNVKLTWRLIIIATVIGIGGIILIGVFGPLGFAIFMGIYIYIIYEILLRIEGFQCLEKSLKSIYDGEKVTLYISDFTNEFEKIVEYINDISNGFENAIEEGLKSERLKTELITNVSHDIKTPLTSIISYVDLLKNENIHDDKAKEYLEILDLKSQRLKKLTDDFLEVSKASFGNLKLDFKNLNIIELLNQAVGEFEEKFKEKNLDIITNFDRPVINIFADSICMYRVMENLFTNIYKYALDGSRVYLEVNNNGKETKIYIKNISKERLNISEEELMQRFVRGDKSRTTEGSGLGLAIAKSLIDVQNGELNCKIDGDLFKVEIIMNN